MIAYRPTDGDVQSTRVTWKPRTCFLMAQMGGPLPANVARREAADLPTAPPSALPDR